MKTAIILILSALLLSLPFMAYAETKANLDMSPLVEALETEDANSLISTLKEFAYWGRFSLPHLERIADFMGNDNSRIRRAASDAISRIIMDAGDEITGTLDVLHDPDPSIRYHSVNRFADLGLLGIFALPSIEHLAANDPNGEVRGTAEVAVRKLKPFIDDSTPILLEILQSGDTELQRIAVVILGEAEPTERIIDALFDHLGDYDRMVRLNAVESLGKLAIVSPEALDVLIAVLDVEDDWYLRYAAVQTLGGIGPDAMRAVPKLSLLLMDEDEDVSTAAKSAIENIGGDPIPHLIALLGTYNPNYSTYKVARILGEIGEPAVPELIQVLKWENPGKRSAALSALSYIGIEAKDAVPILIEILDDDDYSLHSRAAIALGSIGLPAKPAIPPLIEMLDDEDIGFVMMAARALGDIGPCAVEAVPSLLRIAREPDPPVPDEFKDLPYGAYQPSPRWSAVRALGDIGRRQRDVIPLLTELMYSEDEMMLASATFAISQFGKDAVPSLIDLLNDENPDVRSGALKSFVYMGSKAKDAVSNIIERLDDEDEDVRIMAVSALKRMGGVSENALQKLREMAATEEDEHDLEMINTAIEWIETDWTIEKDKAKYRNRILCPG